MMRNWLIKKLIGKPNLYRIHEIALATYDDIWPKHDAYEVKTKTVIFKALVQAYRLGLSRRVGER